MPNEATGIRRRPNRLSSDGETEQLAGWKRTDDGISERRVVENRSDGNPLPLARTQRDGRLYKLRLRNGRKRSLVKGERRRLNSRN